MNRLVDFDNSYARLPERFFARVDPTPVAAPGPVRVNCTLAAQLGIDADRLASAEGTEILAGNLTPVGAEPIATAYAGHQFGGWVPRLGDGRAILLGEVLDRDRVRHDVQLKGSGPTPYSRGGDGRSPLGPVLREYVVSEAMAALGIPTTRALAAVTTGEPVHRETTLTGAVLARVAQSHIRVGTFEYHAGRGDVEAVRTLADHAIARHTPTALEHDNPYLAFLVEVIDRQAALVSRWMSVGFVHGVMNTDNMLVSGETIDYGPCAFVDRFDPRAVFSSIDHGGRYAYGNQPRIAHWNLGRLAQALLPLLDDDPDRAVADAQAVLDAFPDRFSAASARDFGAKVGLEELRPGDHELVDDLLRSMADGGADFTLTFRRLAELAGPRDGGEASVAELVQLPEALDPWLGRWQARLAEDDVDPTRRQEEMLRRNPALIPRNHRVERVIQAAEGGDFAPFHTLVDVLADPFGSHEGQAEWAAPPRPEEVVTATFCGT